MAQPQCPTQPRSSLTMDSAAIMVLPADDLVRIIIATPRDNAGFTQHAWNVYQEAVFMGTEVPKLNATIYEWKLPEPVLTVIGLPAGLNARMSEAQAERMINMLNQCLSAWEQDLAEAGKSK